MVLLVSEMVEKPSARAEFWPEANSALRFARTRLVRRLAPPPAPCVPAGSPLAFASVPRPAPAESGRIHPDVPDPQHDPGLVSGFGDVTPVNGIWFDVPG